ncbi:hypothetical protein EPA93_05755 [Ktedonosporobacter rubrisoli]|uniref:DUF3159 domain-containing protein n=1 Tax=Ktedonosporobacter rubrisoli TaxID=2509675 RepID=A0A4P6JK66_KTERU|nr:VC0807 family protein [Ktedonosporobacter rubrisoli]QBD75534.1 hypothetical protein EPA93_05755 [Ktedonosporobacter rubrisoli]
MNYKRKPNSDSGQNHKQSSAEQQGGLDEQEATSSLEPAQITWDLNIVGLLPGIILDVLLPLGLYFLLKRFIAISDVLALSAASLFPIVDSIVSLLWKRSLDILAIIVLLGTATSIAGILSGGDARFMLLKDSFFSGALGLCCLISLFFPRPALFYIGRQLMAGRDPVRIAAYNAEAKYPYARHIDRLATLVWGLALLGELLLRIVLVQVLPTARAMVVTSTIWIVVVVGTLLWTMLYSRYAMRRLQELKRKAQS